MPLNLSLLLRTGFKGVKLLCVTYYRIHMPRKPVYREKMVVISLHVPPSLLKKLDELASSGYFKSRAEVIRKLIEIGLQNLDGHLEPANTPPIESSYGEYKYVQIKSTGIYLRLTDKFYKKLSAHGIVYLWFCPKHGLVDVTLIFKKYNAKCPLCGEQLEVVQLAPKNFWVKKARELLDMIEDKLRRVLVLLGEDRVDEAYNMLHETIRWMKDKFEEWFIEHN